MRWDLPLALGKVGESRHLFLFWAPWLVMKIIPVKVCLLTWVSLGGSWVVEVKVFNGYTLCYNYGL